VIGLLFTLANSCKNDDKVLSIEDLVITRSNPADISFGTLLSATQLNATADVEGIFVYTPAIGTIMNIGTNQDLIVDFTPTDEATYNVASKTVKVNVTNVAGNSAIFNQAKTYGSVTDINGNSYKTISIGTQTWMAENLRTNKYRDGSAIPIVTNNTEWAALSSGAYCIYVNNETEIPATYGRLYNWYAVADIRNIASRGWHVPTDAEWLTLITFLGGESVAGGKLKETGITHWGSPNTNATNESGFTALPGGYRINIVGTFGDIDARRFRWSSTDTGSTEALHYNM
jgi:uncharacterized protein (TIGR02145 family)